MIGVPIAGDLVIDAWDYWHKDNDIEKMRGELEAYARQSVKDALAEAQMAVAVEAPNLPAETRKKIIEYVSLVPASIRRSLRRPADHTGLTVPAGLALRKPNDLLPFLPATLPRFKAGDQPLPHTDLELIELVGQGGFGEVWKARHLDRPNAPLVALKFCLDTAAAKSLENERTLLDQIASAGRINGIVQLYYTHLRATPPCLEYEYVEGGDLTSLLAELHEKGKPDPSLVARIILQLTKIIAHAHQQKPAIIHRDLKPANILVRRVEKKLSFKIADFGIGALAAKKALLDYTTGKTKMSQQRRATLLGAYTPFYASPEQVGGDFADPRDDVHALGVIWYQLQTGNLSLMTLPSHWRQDLLDAGMPEAYVSILAACIGRLADRPGDAGDLAERLKKLLAPSVPLAPTPCPSPAAEPPRGQDQGSDNEQQARQHVADQTRTEEERRRKYAQEEGECGLVMHTCPSCGGKIGVPDALLGKLVKCPLCQANFDAGCTYCGHQPEGRAKLVYCKTCGKTDIPAALAVLAFVLVLALLGASLLGLVHHDFFGHGWLSNGIGALGAGLSCGMAVSIFVIASDLFKAWAIRAKYARKKQMND